jgi:hypothetical protein
MLKKLAAIFMMTATVSVFAQYNVPLPCMNSAELAELTNEFEELPYVRGVSSNATSVVVWTNPKTGSFTIVERTDNDTFCALVVGRKFEPVPKEIQDNIKELQNKSKL